MLTTFQNNILIWWGNNKRIFPWRETRDPYKILCSEILLQQTNAEKVVQVYNKIISDYPEPADLSEAETADLEEIIKPLGLLKRAGRLKKIAAEITQKYDGIIPADKKALIKLPGVGNYTANAVMCFAFEKQVGVLDTNTIRILARVFDIKSDKARPRNDKNLQNQLNKVIPKNKSKIFNYALLDFAALICTAENPNCGKCVISRICFSYSNKE
ncbi:A/G-specific DNA-adenine glycosylase [Halanaerobium sp. DL-01]|uniref:A/G-specific adenine glycosylase n=1 Tax=Halanaerobium sp. DL-01 TaxID=1653064 RepID=UPI000DF22B17|nr:A/G-specific adenine glycosylase [Halanaerobium sp. DL-01]RCW81653.1 A/G-specific DNA-adenine glycosylase [Halanaerobium sp. DL-01]